MTRPSPCTRRPTKLYYKMHASRFTPVFSGSLAGHLKKKNKGDKKKKSKKGKSSKASKSSKKRKGPKKASTQLSEGIGVNGLRRLRIGDCGQWISNLHLAVGEFVNCEFHHMVVKPIFQPFPQGSEIRGSARSPIHAVPLYLNTNIRAKAPIKSDDVKSADVKSADRQKRRG